MATTVDLAGCHQLLPKEFPSAWQKARKRALLCIGNYRSELGGNDSASRLLFGGLLANMQRVG